MAIHEGGCHCGAIRMTYSSAVPAAEHALRACQCSFCRRHGSIAVSDPDGAVEIRIGDEAKASRYRFGLGTADYIVCRECGVYVAAVMTEGGKSWSVAIVNALDDRADFAGTGRAGGFLGGGWGRSQGATPRPLDPDHFCPDLMHIGSHSNVSGDSIYQRNSSTAEICRRTQPTGIVTNSAALPSPSLAVLMIAE